VQPIINCRIPVGRDEEATEGMPEARQHKDMGPQNQQLNLIIIFPHCGSQKVRIPQTATVSKSNTGFVMEAE
jgi:hypothetical protein